MIKCLIYFLSTVVILFVFATVHAVDQAYLSADNMQPKLGEPIQLLLHIRVPKDAKLILPNFVNDFAPLTITKVGSLNVINPSDNADVEYQVPLTAVLWQLGISVTPALNLSYQVAGKSPVDLRVEPLQFDVPSTLSLNDVNLRPFKSQIFLPYVPAWIPLSLVLFVCAIITFIIRLRQIKFWKLRGQIIERQKMFNMDVTQILNTLEQVQASTESSLYIFGQVTNCLRAYIKHRYGIEALDLTTVELMDNLRQRELLPNDEFQILLDMLRRADLVKFARAVPKHTVAQQYATKAAEWIVAVEETLVDRVS